MTLQEWLAAREDRCAAGFHAVQHPNPCHCGGLIEGKRLAARGMSAASNARPSDRAAVDAAIRRLAAEGKPFSANQARAIHHVRGPVVGAAFQAAAKAGLIVKVGFEPSTDPGTHAHPVAMWTGVAA